MIKARKLWCALTLAAPVLAGLLSQESAAAEGAAVAKTASSASWNFNEGAVRDATVATLGGAGWTFNKAAEQAGAVTVRPGRLGILQDYLAIEDVVNGGAGSFPVVRLPFGPRPNGQANFNAALFGVKHQFGAIWPMNGETPLAQITIKDGDGGTVKTGDGEVAFSGPNWAKTGGAIQIIWTAGAAGKPGRVSIVMEGLAKPVANAALMGDFAPDALQFQAGFNSGVNKGLAIDDIQLNFPQTAGQ